MGIETGFLSGPSQPNMPGPYMQVTNVKAAPYNAKGDGIADDTRAIQQALNDSPITVYLPAGTYNISAALVLGLGRRLVGAGMFETVIHQTVLPTPGTVPNSATPFDILQITGSNVQVSDLTLQGPTAPGFPPLLASAQGQKGIVIQGPANPAPRTQNILIERIYMFGIQANGIQVWQNTQYVTIRDIILQLCGNEGILVAADAPYTVIERVDIAQVRSWGIDSNSGLFRCSNFSCDQCGDSTHLNDGGGITFTAVDNTGLPTTLDDVLIEQGSITRYIGQGVNLTPAVSVGNVSRRVIVRGLTIFFDAVYSARANMVAGLFVSFAGGANLGTFEGLIIDSINSVNGPFSLQPAVASASLINCMSLNLLSLAADPDPSSTSQGFRIDVSASGDVQMIGCHSKGWHRGVQISSCRWYQSIGNIAENNDIAGFDWVTYTNGLMSVGDRGSGNPAGSDFIIGLEAITQVFGARGTFSNAGNPDGQNHSRNIRPAADATYNLGNATFGWAQLFLSQFGQVNINNIKVLGPQIAGYGTPTNGAQIANFPGNTATLAQCGQEISRIILDLKTHGLLGA